MVEEKGNNTDIEKIIDLSVKRAIRIYASELRADQRKKSLHNTKLLLKNYDKIKSSIELSIDELSQKSFDYDIDLSDVTNVDGDRLYIDSIRRSKARSVIIISHIESALNMMKIDKEKSGMLEKYNVFYSCTIEKMSYDEAAQQYNSSIATVSRWIKELTKEMSIYIFGVDGINEL